MTAGYLLDTSAFVRLARPGVEHALIHAESVGVCGSVLLELLFGARNKREFCANRRDIEVGFAILPTVQQDFDRALDVMAELCDRGAHRSVPLPDLLTAAVAERAGLIVLHYDADFEKIAAITSQPNQWLAPRGSID